MTEPGLVFLLDVDNTLLNNDRLKNDLAVRIRDLIGVERSRRFWELYEQVRQEEDYVDFPTTIARLAQETHEPDLAKRLTELLDNWPFVRYLYPHVMETIGHLNDLGTAVILSDGDPVFQPLKIEKSGLRTAVDGRVLIYVHKEQHIADVETRYPASHYAIVDDKPRILADMGTCCTALFTTVLVQQGKYAKALGQFSPGPNYVVPHIGDLRHFTAAQFLTPPPPVVETVPARGGLSSQEP